MDNALYIGLGVQSALRKKMDIVANNIANMNTTAYNKERMIFREQLQQVDGEAATTNGNISTTAPFKSVRDISRGAFQMTHNSLDVAIAGDGYIGVQDAAGNTLYTRNGSLQLNNQNQLTTNSGHPVLDESGQPIVFNSDDANISISKEGTITSQNRTIGKMAVYKFNNEHLMDRVGNSLYRTNQPVQLSDNFEIKQGYLEASNVNAVESITDMMKISKHYQGVSDSMKKLDQLRLEALRRLSRVR